VLTGRSPARAVAAAALLLLAACARHEEAAHETATAHAAPANPSSFPLYRGSAVVTVVPVDSSRVIAAMKASDPHADLPQNFRGHEVIAQTGASMHDLNAWLDALGKAPPQGLHRVEQHGGKSQIGNDRTILSGLTFESAGGRRAVYVIAADPRKLRDQLGPVFALIENYGAVPGVLRAPIDDQAKKQFGYSVSEMLDKRSPAGAVIDALERLRSENRRGILLIDETRA
jgi:hypothetical protein